MGKTPVAVRGVQSHVLKCHRCGNDEKFMEYTDEAHIVSGNMDYVRLAWAETQRYECFECFAIVKPGLSSRHRT